MLQTRVEVSAVSHNRDKLAKVRAGILRSEVCRNMWKVGRVELPGKESRSFQKETCFQSVENVSSLCCISWQPANTPELFFFLEFLYFKTITVENCEQ